MKRIVLIACVLWTQATLAGALAPHPGVVEGRLENGLEYRILAHAHPPASVSLRLHLPVGSFNEAEDELGFAHLLEHLAFTGSENFPAGGVMPAFAAMGLTLGHHQNAMTGFDQTVYMLDIPAASADALDLGLTFFADILGRLTFDDAAVEQERAVVLAEARARLGPMQRLFDARLPRMFAGTLAAERPPIGTEATVRAATAERLRAFHARWYTTGNATLVVVGDIEPDVMSARIADAFGDLPAGPPTARVEPGVVAHDSAFAIVGSDEDIRTARVALMTVGPPRPPVTTADDARDALRMSLAMAVLNRRLADAVARGETAFSAAFAGSGPLHGVAWRVGVDAFGDPAGWRDMVADVARELARAHGAGFSEDELDLARRTLLAGARRAVAAEETVPSAALASAAVASIAEGDVFQSAAQRLELIEALVPAIDAAEASAAFTDAFDPSTMVVDVHLAPTDAMPDEAEVLGAAVAAFADEYAPPEARDRRSAWMEALPEPGRVAEARLDDGNDVLSGWLDNGVRFHHRYMDERRGHVGVRVVLAGGGIEERGPTIGLTLAGVGSLRRLATKSLASADVRDMLAGTTVSIGLQTYPDAVVVSVHGAPDEIEHGMQLLHLLLTEPLIEPPAFEHGKQGMLRSIEAASRDVNARLGDALTYARHPDDDPRWLPFDAERVAALERGAAQRWVESLFARAPIEAAVVGEIERDAAVELMKRYLGSLPVRPRIGPATLADLRRVPHSDDDLRTTLHVATATPRAAVFVGFRGADHDAHDDVRPLVQAARILSERLMRDVREREGLTYAVGASHSAAIVLPGFGTFGSGASVDPEHAERVADLIEAAFAAFAAEGPTDEEVATAWRQFETSFSETARDPGYWLNRLMTHTYRGEPRVDPAATMDAYRAIDATRIHETFRRYRDRGPSWRAVVVPGP